MRNEIWKDIAGYEGLYQISNTGKVKSLAFTKFWGGKPNPTDIILVQRQNPRGYLYVTLCKNLIGKSMRIHRLVIEAFIPNTLNKPTANHIDGNCLNNNVENLEWATFSENTLHAHRIGLASNKSGTEATKRKVIDVITKLTYPSVTDAAEAIGMKRNTLNKMLCGTNFNKTNLIYL